MKLYRGVSLKKYEEYKRKGIPKNTKFINRLSRARMWGKQIITLNYDKKKFKPNEKANFTFRQLHLQDRYYTTNKIIKKFKLR